MSMRCPSCKTQTLRPFRESASGLEVDACSDCTGIWFDPHELGTFLKSDVMKQRFLWMDAVPASSVGYVINTTRRRCPRDSQPMDEKIYAGITLDSCPKCKGIWFDEGEVRQVVERYKRGMASGDAEVANEMREGMRGKSAAAGGFGGLVEFLRGLVHKD